MGCSQRPGGLRRKRWSRRCIAWSQRGARARLSCLVLTCGARRIEAATWTYWSVTDNAVANVRKESARLGHALRGVRLCVDVLAVREEDFNRLKDKIGLICRETIRHGTVVYEAGQGVRSKAMPRNGWPTPTGISTTPGSDRKMPRPWRA